MRRRTPDPLAILAGLLAGIIGSAAVLALAGAPDRPAPLPPTPATPTLTDTCSRGKYRVWTTSTGAIAVYPDPNCGDTK